MNNFLELLGYKFIGTCNCDGYLTHKYKKGDYKVKVRVKRDQYKVLKHGVDVTGWKPFTELSKRDFHATIQESV